MGAVSVSVVVPGNALVEAESVNAVEVDSWKIHVAVVVSSVDDADLHKEGEDEETGGERRDDRQEDESRHANISLGFVTKTLKTRTPFDYLQSSSSSGWAINHPSWQRPSSFWR